MEIENISIELKNRNSIQLPLNQKRKQIVIDSSNEMKSKKIILLCYQIHLSQENQNIFVYLFKNIDPNSFWYEKKIREGDRLISLNGQDPTLIPSDQIYSILMANQLSVKFEVIWHPELYLEFNDKRLCSMEEKPSIESRKMINENLYEYLTKTIRCLLDYQPTNVGRLVVVEEKPHHSIIESNELAQKQFNLLLNRSDIEGNPDEIMKNMLELHDLFEEIDVGLNRDEIYWIWLLMKCLLKEKEHVEKLRFWGKIFGLTNNYYIFEVDFNSFDHLDSEFVEEEEEEEEIITNKADAIGNGVNQKIFFVTTGLNQSFVQLPLLTPEHIEHSRRIQQFFTGNLEAKVKNEENFPGVEKHLLRAQIQRITSGTYIGPRNYFKHSINNDDDDEQMDEDTIDRMPNEFVGNTLEDLSLPNGQYWIHYMPRLPHSDVKLSSIDQDSKLNNGQSAWSIRVKSTLVPEYARIAIQSNRWPGAYTVGDRYRFENIYIGWAVKNHIETHQADMINRLPENEYLDELNELNDPTIDDENGLFKSSILLSPNDDEEFDND